MGCGCSQDPKRARREPRAGRFVREGSFGREDRGRRTEEGAGAHRELRWLAKLALVAQAARFHRYSSARRPKAGSRANVRSHSRATVALRAMRAARHKSHLVYIKSGHLVFLKSGSEYSATSTRRLPAARAWVGRRAEDSSRRPLGFIVTRLGVLGDHPSLHVGCLKCRWRRAEDSSRRPAFIIAAIRLLMGPPLAPIMNGTQANFDVGCLKCLCWTRLPAARAWVGRRAEA